MINALRCFLEILLLRFGDFHELLRVPVNKREPGALYMNHHHVSFSESVVDIRHLENDRCRLPWHKGKRFLKSVSILPAERLSTDQLLVTAHLRGIRGGCLRENGNFQAPPSDIPTARVQTVFRA